MHSVQNMCQGTRDDAQYLTKALDGEKSGQDIFIQLVYEELGKGYSLLEALIITSINPKYDDRLFVEFKRKLQVQYKLCTSNCYELQKKKKTI